MAECSLHPATRDRLESVRENADILCEQITGSRNSVPSLPIIGPEFYTKMLSTSELVSKECTKLVALLAAVDASEDECGRVCGKLEQSCMQLVNTLYQLDVDLGETLRVEVKKRVLSVLRAVSLLMDKIMKGRSVLQGAGSVWETCTAMAKVAKDNKLAVINQVISVFHLLNDASEEAEDLLHRRGRPDMEAMEEEETEDADINSMLGKVNLEEVGNGVEEWNEKEEEIAARCIRLIEVATQYTRYVWGDLTLNLAAGVKEIDCIATEVQLLSPMVDDFVSELPAPLDVKITSHMAVTLGKTILKFMETVDDSCRDDYSSADDNKLRDDVKRITSLFKDS